MTDRDEADQDEADLLEADLLLHGRVMPASNATFVGEVTGTRVVYKPVAGERPLWDFPQGTLAGREVAAYLLSEALGWGVVPRTFLRDGPHGRGMVQIWQEPDEAQEAVDLVPAGRTPAGWRRVFDGVDAEDRRVSLVHEDTEALRRMAVFDVIVNNADRKGGHVLPMPGGHRYGVDHGVTFHAEPKLRTVLWGWAGEPLARAEVEAVARIADALSDDQSGDQSDKLGTQLLDHLTAREVAATRRRCAALLTAQRLPEPSGEWPAIPWPPF